MTESGPPASASARTHPATTAGPRRAGGAPIAWTDLPGLLMLAVHAFGRPAGGIDDAFIFYRYAANWAAGLGPVFNPGERVEGFSSLLWTALLALGARVGAPPELLAPWLGMGFAAVALVLAGRFARRALPGATWLHLAVPLALACSTGFAFYALSGMDTAVFAFALLLAVLALCSALDDGRVRGFAASLVLLVVVRAEGPLYAVVLAALYALFARRDPAVRGAVRRAVIVVALATVVLLLVRHAWSGAWIPASLASKSATTHALLAALSGHGAWREWVRLLDHGVRYAAFALPLLLVPAAAIALRPAARRFSEPAIVVALAVATLAVVVTVWAGGDWMPHHRHLLPVWGLLLALLAWGVLELARRVTPPAIAAALALGALAGAGAASFTGPIQPAPPWAPHALEQGEYGRRLRDIARVLHDTPPPVVMLTNMAGEVAYFAGPGLYVRDLLGLTDRHNSLYGSVWVPTYGRTDPAYSFGTPCDLMISNTSSDLIRLLAYGARDSLGVSTFALLSAPEWIDHRCFVAVRAGGPVTDALRSLAGGSAPSLDSTSVRLIRDAELSASHWTLDGLAERLAAARAGAAR